MRLTPFYDRADAGRLLADVLSSPTAPAVVVGLARGGVAVAAEVARVLGLPLDALAVRKVPHPSSHEYALGAVAPGGVAVMLDRGLAVSIPEALVRDATTRADELDRRIHSACPALPVSGRTCILVDDGIATGATMLAAIRWARNHDAREVWATAPVASVSAARFIDAAADVTHFIEVSDELRAVSAWYEQFDQIDTAQVTALLTASRQAAVQ
jgi:putative phosphoribosyl transferase